MSDLHTNAADANREQIYELADALLGDTITADEAERLRALVCGDAEARRHYVRFMFDSVLLRQLGKEEGAEASIHPSSFIPHPLSIPPIVLDVSPALHSPLFTLHSPVGSFVFSHLIAAVILGVGLLAGLAWRISLPTDVGGDSSRIPDVAKVDWRQEPSPTVGHITALADCRWKQWEVESGEWRVESGSMNLQISKSPNSKFLVSLGSKYRLASGFMEITYDTGAKVLLEGPCTYEIESARGGFLAIGKLTALVEKGEGRRVKGEKGAGSRPLTLDSGLFAVRTPTAIVTDLGTEFGVEVEKSGTTRSHVFQGKIELRSQENNSRGLTAPGASPVDHVVQLTAGESARVERGRNRVVAITREPGQPERFVRRMPRGQVQSPESRVQSQNRQLGDSRLSTLNSRLRYRLTDLGTLGGAASRANAINAVGQVVGEASTSSGASHAFLYADGKMKDLGVLHGGNSCAKGVNTFGQVVGWTGTSNADYRAFFFDGGKMSDLGTLGGPVAYAYAINDTGAVVGASLNASGTTRAFFHTQSDGIKELGALGGSKAYSCAFGINATGQAVGYSETHGGSGHAFLYIPGVGMKDLGVISGHRGIAFDVNDVGAVVGVFDVRGGLRRAFVYSNDAGIKNLGSLGGPNGCAFKINNAGQVVGAIGRINHGAVRTCAFLYSGGKMRDLNLLIDPAVGWTLTAATAINDSGQIAGFGRAPDGNMRAFLLAPLKGLVIKD